VLFQKEIDFARSVAMHAGDVAMGYAARELKPETKPDLSPVTIADRECEALIASRIAEAFPDDGILGEEGSDKPSRNGRRWIVDPIDGTRDFVRGLPLWSVLIGLEVDGDVVAGIAHMPLRRESYFAVKGHGAYRNDTRISISAISEARHALVSVSGLNFASTLPFAPRIVDWLAQFWAFRSFGGCLDACLLASGHAEVWIEPQAKAWDLAALKIILEEAGAHFFNFDGGSSIDGGNCAACVPALEPVVRSLVVAR
jgi:histidinol phosphatase-like enzyme (inositol monophosphatase family)